MIDEALCFGWIDSKPNRRDEQSYYIYFARRNPKSNWSRINKEKVAKLISENKMSDSGLQLIEIAKTNGCWDILNDVENLILPDDLKALFEQSPEAFANWEQFPRSAKRGILEWIFNAKRQNTRQKRIVQTVTRAAQNIKAIN